MTNKLQEENKLSPADLTVKMKKLDSFIKKAERRITMQEKKLAKLREQLRSEFRLIKGRITA